MLSILTLVFLVSVAYGLFPDTPALFATRLQLPQPVVAFAFKQTECPNGVFLDAFNGPLTLTATNFVCNPNKTGVFVNSLSSSNQIISSELGSVLPQSTSFSVELWAAIQQRGEQSSLIELGGRMYNKSTIGVSSNNIHFQLLLSSSGTFELRFASSAARGVHTVYFDKACAIRFPTSTLVPQHIVLTVNGTRSYGNNVRLYVGNINGDMVMCEDDSREFASFVYSPSSALRIAGTRALETTGFKGEVYLTSWFNTQLSSDQVRVLHSARLPNNIPSCNRFVIGGIQRITTSFSFYSASCYDADGDAISHVMFTSDPYPGVMAPSVINTPYTFNTIFSYYAANQDTFSQARTDLPCTLPFITFLFAVSDSVCEHTSQQSTLSRNCFSPINIVGSICIKDAQDLPTSSNLVLPSLRIGESYIFNISITDLDDFIVDANGDRSGFRARVANNPNIFMPLTAVFFAGTTSDVKASIFYVDPVTGTCSSSAVPPDTWVGPSSRGFLFCMKTNPLYSDPASVSFGSVAFSFKVRDGAEGESLSFYSITAAINTPLRTCYQGDIVSTSLGMNGCESEGFEYDGSFSTSPIPIYLTGYDTNGQRSLTVTIRSLPAHGILRTPAGVTLQVGSTIPAVSTFTPNAYYIGAFEFFTRTDSTSMAYRKFNPNHQITQYTDLDGVPFNGCGTSNYPGCPETFTYDVSINGQAKSTTATYMLHVNGVASMPGIQCPNTNNNLACPATWQTFYGCSPTLNPQCTGIAGPHWMSTRCEFFDHDKNAFWVGLSIRVACSSSTQCYLSLDSSVNMYEFGKSRTDRGCWEVGCGNPGSGNEFYLGVIASPKKMRDIVRSLKWDYIHAGATTYEFQIANQPPYGVGYGGSFSFPTRVTRGSFNIYLDSGQCSG